MRTILRTASALALLVGISGCFFPFHDHDRRGGDRRTDRHGDAYRDPHFTVTEREPPVQDCWRQGNRIVCRGDRD